MIESIHQPRKTIWRPRGTPSIAYRRISEGTLIVDPINQIIKSTLGPGRHEDSSIPRIIEPYPLFPREDGDGYLVLDLRYRYQVNCGPHGGKRWIRKREKTGVHRIIWIAANGKDIPHGLEVHHIDLDRQNNHPDNLCLHTELAQRQRSEDLHEYEAAAIAEYMKGEF